MNFLFFPGGSYIGGMEIVTESLMAQLNAMGHRTFAMISGWNNGGYPARLRASGLSFSELKLGRFYRSRPLWTLDTLLNMPGAALKLRRLVSEFCPDVAIYPDPQLLLIGSLILPKLSNLLYQHTDASGLRTFPSIKVINARLDCVVCVSNFVAASARAFGFEAKKIAVVHNGVVLPARVVPASRHQSINLGIVGRVSPQKQHMMLVRALARLRERHPSIEFYLKIIGTDDLAYAQDVKELIRELKLQDIVEWSGFFTNRDDIYRELDVVVAPAVNEAFGMTIVEAGAYGLPVVAARSGGFSELVLDGTTGLLFDATDLEAFVAALEKLITDPALRNRLGRAGRTHVSQGFSIERMAQRFVEVLSFSETR